MGFNKIYLHQCTGKTTSGNISVNCIWIISTGWIAVTENAVGCL